MSARAMLLLALAAALACAPPARAQAERGSALAYPLMSGGDAPGLRLAQRAIEREWGPSADSLYTVVRVPDWRSEGLAMTLSAAVPGAGQLYDGEQSGYLFLLAEAAGWISRVVFQRRADDRRDDAARFAGTPGDSASAFSALRWAAATGGDPSTLEDLYANDRSAYLRLIGTDDVYLSGWSGNSAATRRTFDGMRDGSQRMYVRARYADVALMLNHVLAAVDALHAARVHDLPLRPDLELHLRGGWRSGGPVLMASLERRF